ncbi:MAG: plasmid replication protein, CyRepA1 family [Microcoleaceae cyanobacterium]
MNHLAEWNASCVDPQLTLLNVTPLEKDRPLNYLLYADTLPRRNDGRVSSSVLNRYQHVFDGGWWCSGVDLLTGEDDTWGCFKPTNPRIDPNRNKVIKYEHPPQVATSVFALKVTQPIWQQIAHNHNLTLSDTEIQHHAPDLGFWEWIDRHPEIPLCITEGAKKAGALLTAGYAAIALPGIHNGYRTPKDAWGNRIGKSRLIPQLQKLATQNRPIHIVFDQESRPKSVKAVDIATQQLGYLLAQQGCVVKVVTWNPDLGKGVDDLIANQGQTAFDEAYTNALPLETWRALSFNRLTYSADISVNSRYLPELEIPPTARLVGIKSPKGTGKTQLLEQVVKQARNRGQSVLVISHRVRLVEALCQRFGLEYLRKSVDHSSEDLNIDSIESTEPTTEIRNTQGSVNLAQPNIDNPEPPKGYGLCIDSLRPDSSAQFKPENWTNALVVIDEVEQVLWHGLNSDTCRNQRVSILKSLKTLMQNTLGEFGQVIVADADLSDVSLDYLLSLAGVEQEPFVVENTWKPGPEAAWQVHTYGGKTPKQLVNHLEGHIIEGGKPFVCLSAQKIASKWGTCTLETYLKTQFPDKKILRIDSESLADPTHPAYGCIENLNQVLPNYDIVLASPCIETGVSIEIPDHFTSVWGIFQGIQAENSVRQALGRIRANLPRHLWIANRGFNSVGNGATSMSVLLGSSHRLTQLNIRMLQQSDFDTLEDLELGFQAESLRCWAKMAVRFNAAMGRYRESILSALSAEGHQILEVDVNAELVDPDVEASESATNRPSLTDLIEAVRDQNYQTECRAIIMSPELSGYQYQMLQQQLVKTPEDRRSQRKYELRLRYGIPVTPDLVVKDDQGWYDQLRIHYFLTVGRAYLQGRDAVIARRLLSQGEGNIFVPDFNRSQFGAMIGTMELLGVPVLLQSPDRELRNTDADLQQMAALALRDRSAIKSILGIGLAKNSSPVTIVRRLLMKVGYGIQLIRCERDKTRRIRVYQIVEPQDGRLTVFQQWLLFAGQCPGVQASLDLDEPIAESAVVESVEAEFQQMCLRF